MTVHMIMDQFMNCGHQNAFGFELQLYLEYAACYAYFVFYQVYYAYFVFYQVPITAWANF